MHVHMHFNMNSTLHVVPWANASEVKLEKLGSSEIGPEIASRQPLLPGG